MAWDTTRYTDWQKELWGNMGINTTINASLAGGNEFTHYRLSGGFDRFTDILTKSGSNKIYSLDFSLGHTSLNRKFKTEFRGKYARTEVDMVFTPSPTILPPNAPPIFASNGTLNFKEYNDAGMAPEAFPFGGLKNNYFSGTNKLALALDLGYEIINNLKAKVNIGYNTSDNNAATQIPIAAQNPVMNPTGTHNSGVTSIRNWLIEPQLTYKLRVGGPGRVDFLAGASYQSNITKANSIIALGFTNDAYLNSLNLAGFVFNSNSQAEYKYAAVFGRVSFNWDEKYIVNLSGRRDGSSRFGSKSQFGNFGSIGLAYILSEEAWMKRILPEQISFIKLRSSYSSTGSDAVGDYKYLTQWSVTMPDPAGGLGITPYYPFDGINPLVSQLHVNPDYHWQVKKNIDLGLSLGFLNDRILMEVSHYREKIHDQLTFFPIPAYTGFPGVTANWPAVLKNTGLEIGVSARLIEKKDLKLSVSFNIGKNKNTLDEYPDFDKSPYVGLYKVGESLNAKYLYHYLGVDPQTGRYSFEDRNKDGSLSYDISRPPGEGYDDRYVVLDLAPKYNGGFGISTTWKQWNLNLHFSFQRGYIRDVRFPQDPIGRMSNMPVDVIGNYWQKPGDVKRFAAPTTLSTTSMNNFEMSDGFYLNMKMVRLSGLNIAYSFPETWMQKLRLRSGSIFLRASNLFFISNTSGLDPETVYVGSMPMPRTVTGGFAISL
jgi:TonB-linked SusC/RagA family outer membrane protein